MKLDGSLLNFDYNGLLALSHTCKNGLSLVFGRYVGTNISEKFVTSINRVQAISPLFSLIYPEDKGKSSSEMLVPHYTKSDPRKAYSWFIIAFTKISLLTLQ
jgi:hypothetical protein